MTKVLRFLGYAWSLPNSLIGFVLMVTWYLPKSVRWKDGALEVVIRRKSLIGGEWVGAQTYGWVIFCKNEKQRDRPDLAVHERVHVRDAMVFGIFFLLMYGLCFLYEWRKLDFENWTEAYRSNWWEARAYAAEDEYEQNKKMVRLVKDA